MIKYVYWAERSFTTINFCFIKWKKKKRLKKHVPSVTILVSFQFLSQIIGILALHSVVPKSNSASVSSFWNENSLPCDMFSRTTIFETSLLVLVDRRFQTNERKRISFRTLNLIIISRWCRWEWRGCRSTKIDINVSRIDILYHKVSNCGLLLWTAPSIAYKADDKNDYYNYGIILIRNSMMQMNEINKMLCVNLWQLNQITLYH